MIKSSLGISRLVSVVGSGGMGKTTVAIAAAAAIEHDEGSSVAFVDFGRVAGEEYVPATLLASLGISSVSGDSMQAIVAVLAKSKMLIILDTCEHVVAAVAHIVRILLEKTMYVRILATSREVLRIKDEMVIWLDPLDVPPHSVANLEEVLEYSAPRLLLQLAEQLSEYRPSKGEFRLISEICRRLDGTPLAIELVASAFSAKSPALILSAISHRFGSLRLSGQADAPRQQTLLATLQWSYSLLSENEATILRAVSIFAGAFDMDAVVAVAVHRSIDLAHTLDAISGLRSKSMLSVDQRSGKLRYRLLDTTRAFARELAETRIETAMVSSLHARLVLDMLNRANREREQAGTSEARDGFLALSDDLRKALDWCLQQGHDSLVGIQLVAAGLPLWRELSLAEEMKSNCERALIELERSASTDKTLKLVIIVGLASASTYLATDQKSTTHLYETVIQLARESNDPASECRALSALITYSLLSETDSTPSEMLNDLRNAANLSKDKRAFWEYEQLVAHCDTNNGAFLSSVTSLERLYSEIMRFEEGAAPSFQLFQKNNVEVQLAATLWLAGRPGDAKSHVLRAIHNLGASHALTIVHSLGRGILWTLCMCRESTLVHRYADLLKTTVYQHGMSSWIPLADTFCLLGAAMAGEPVLASALRENFTALKSMPIQLQSYGYFILLAQAMIDIGQPRDAATVVSHCLAAGYKKWCMPEVLRLRAETQRALGSIPEAIASLRESLSLSDMFEGVAWKLRSAVSLASILRDQGDMSAALQVLEPVYAQAFDAFDTGDVRIARELLSATE
ncbi:MAG: NB-ARC domain-containing protein [Steroidobacteraceae bacterium]